MSKDRGGTNDDVVRENADTYRREMIEYGLYSVVGMVVLLFTVRIVRTGELDDVLVWLLIVGSALLAIGGVCVAIYSWKNWRHCLKLLKKQE